MSCLGLLEFASHEMIAFGAILFLIKKFFIPFVHFLQDDSTMVSLFSLVEIFRACEIEWFYEQTKK